MDSELFTKQKLLIKHPLTQKSCFLSTGTSALSKAVDVQSVMKQSCKREEVWTHDTQSN